MVAQLLEQLFAATLLSYASLPPAGMVAVPFILGLATGYLLKKVVKLIVIVVAGIVLLTLTGVLSLEQVSGFLRRALTTNLPGVLDQASRSVGTMPLGLGFVAGFTVGLLMA